MQNKGPSKRIVVITACIPFLLFIAGCKKTWTPPKSSPTPTRAIHVVDVNQQIEDNKDKNGNLVPAPTLFPNRRGQEGDLTPTPAFTPTPTPAVTPGTGWPDPFATPVPTPLPTPTPTPSPKPTNTPRPTRVPPTPVATPAEPTATPTPGSVDYILVTGTPTPRI